MASPTPASAPGASNSLLHAARRSKNDEFYTQMSDIENELKHYKSQFRGKVVFCNCDDVSSSFLNYFKNSFEHLELSRLVATHYEQGTQSYKLEYFLDGKTLKEEKTRLAGDGDFRSPECLAILAEADIVVTNPPFSLFREYVTQLVEHGKQFLIIGNNNAITYKETFKLLKGGHIWLGHSANKTMEFQLSDDYERWDRLDAATGKKFGSVPAISWFTNLTHKKRSEELTLFRRYCGNEGQYPKYENYDAIEVSKVNDIPCDYTGHMGVPITFLGKHNPAQFEIVGLANDKRIVDDAFVQGAETYLDEQHKKFVGMVLAENGKLRATYARIIIRAKAQEVEPA